MTPYDVMVHPNIDALGRLREWLNAASRAHIQVLTEVQELKRPAPGVVDERVHRAAVEEKDRLIKYRAFYRRLLDGDREANRQWASLTSLLALRPVKCT